MTNAQMIARLRRPGKCLVPVVHEHGVAHIVCDKSDLIDFLLGADAPDADCLWSIYEDNGKSFRIDVA